MKSRDASASKNHGSTVRKSQKCEKCIFRTLEQAATNICSMEYHNSNFKIDLSLFGCAEKYIEQSTPCAVQ